MVRSSMVGLSNRALARAGIWVVGGQLVAAVGGIATLRLLTEFAEPQVFGEASLVLAALALGLQLFVAPSTSTQLRFHAEAESRGAAPAFTVAVLRHALRATFLLAVVMAVVYAAAVAFGELAPSAWLVLGGCCWILVNTCRNVLLGRVHASGHPILYAMIQAAEVLLIGLCSVLLLQAVQPDPASIVLGQVLGVGAIALALYRWWPRDVPAEALSRERAALRSRVRSYGLAFAPLSALNWAATLADRYVIGALLGAAAAGLYAAPATIATRGMALGNAALGDLLRPGLFAAASRNDGVASDRLLRFWLLAGVGIGSLAVLVLFLAGDLVARWLLAEEYRASARPILVWTAAGNGLLGLSQALETGLLALNRSSDLIAPMAVGAVVLVVTAWVLVPLNGVVGAAQAATVGFGARTVAVAVLLLVRRAARPVAPIPP
jgi:O-antigen/teichoic acid export membrane protein